MTKEIMLSQSKVALVDDEDFESLNQHKWQANDRGGGRFYADRTGFDSGVMFRLRMHRVIMGAKKGMEVDHIDGDGLNNSRSNLRFCTSSQNQMNRKKRKGCSSKFKGVTWRGANKKWVAQITIEGVNTHLGSFSEEKEAAKSYDKAAKKYFGKFARPNFPGIILIKGGRDDE